MKSYLLLVVSASVVAFLGFSTTLTVASQWQDEAEREGQVVLYTTANTSDAKAITDGFKKAYPKMDIRFYRTTDSQLMERILTEARAGQSLWDVVSTTGFYGYQLKKRGLLAPYDSPERKYYREGFKDPQEFWTSTYTTYAVFGYNTKLVLQADIPRSHGDLLKPAWKGQIGMEGRAYEWFTATISGMGRKKGLSYMRALAAQGPNLRIGRTLLAQLVAAGEFKGTLTAYTHSFQTLHAGGAPVDWIALAPTYANIHPLGISAKAPHPNAGKLFVDYALSKQGQEVFRSLRRIPDRVDTPPDPPNLLDGIVPSFTDPEIYEDFDRYIKLFREIFGSK